MNENVTEESLGAAFSKVVFEVPVAHILHRARRRRLRRRMILALPVVGLLAAWGATVIAADDLEPNGVLCYDRPPNRENYGQWPNGNTGEDPRTICGRLWASGEMVPDSTEIPPLKVCAWKVGAVVVFPARNGESCSSVGLQEMPDGYMARVQRFVAMRDEMEAELRRAALAGSTPEAACLDKEEARRIVTQVLAAFKFDGWTIDAGEKTDTERCMQDIELDADGKKATIYATFSGVKAIYVF